MFWSHHSNISTSDFPAARASWIFLVPDFRLMGKVITSIADADGEAGHPFCEVCVAVNVVVTPPPCSPKL
jgi:hypothetical protein